MASKMPISSLRRRRTRSSSTKHPSRRIKHHRQISSAAISANPILSQSQLHSSKTHSTYSMILQTSIKQIHNIKKTSLRQDSAILTSANRHSRIPWLHSRSRASRRRSQLKCRGQSTSGNISKLKVRRKMSGTSPSSSLDPKSMPGLVDKSHQVEPEDSWQVRRITSKSSFAPSIQSSGQVTPGKSSEWTR